MKSFYKKIAATAFALAATAATLPARAETFNYTGNLFNAGPSGVAGSPLTTELGTSINASFTFDNSVTNNYTGAASITNIVSFFVYTGSYAISASVTENFLSPSASPSFYFDKGSIIGWAYTAVAPSGYYVAISSWNKDTVNYGYDMSANNQNANLIMNSPGTWTQASVSVPGPVAGAGLPALLAVLGGVAAARRQRKNRALTLG